VGKSVNFVDTRATKFIKKGLFLWLLCDHCDCA